MTEEGCGSLGVTQGASEAGPQRPPQEAQSSPRLQGQLGHEEQNLGTVHGTCGSSVP